MPPSNEGRAEFTVQIGDVEFAQSGAAGRTMRGHAAVYNRLSHDLGGFKTRIAPGAFDAVLDSNPDVHLLWDHNTRYVLARTKNKSLELRSDPMGLHVWARFADTPTSHELSTLMEGGYIDQMSFACDIGSDTWTEDADGNITRSIESIDALYDVTVCAQGAFPQTDSQLVASMSNAGDLLASAIEAGRVEGRAASEEVAPETVGTEETSVAETGTEDVANVGVPTLVAMKAAIKARFAAATTP